jgi:hypothetical protein
MKIILNEDDMKPESYLNWKDSDKRNLVLEDFYLSAHNIKTADCIIFESDSIPFKLVLKGSN